MATGGRETARVLVVEDSPVVRIPLRAALTAAGFALPWCTRSRFPR